MIIGTIVTYNPDIYILRKNILAVIDQVDRLIIVDNNSLNLSKIKSSIDNRITIFEMNTNIGIAGALQFALEVATDEGFTYLFTLDQDSICEKGLVAQLLEGFKRDKNVAICGPMIVDRNISDKNNMKLKDRYEVVDRLISSGSLCDIHKLKKVGGINVRLFIDSVDFELCYRLRRNGYSVSRCNAVNLSHQLGEQKKILNRFYTSNHSAYRLYYIARNSLFVNRQFADLEDVKNQKPLVSLFKRGVKIMIAEKNKTQKIKAIIKGIDDSRKFDAKM